MYIGIGIAIFGIIVAVKRDEKFVIDNYLDDGIPSYLRIKRRFRKGK